MQNNNKKSLLAIGVLTIIFAFLSIFMVSNIYQKPNQGNNSIFDLFDRKDSYISGLEENLKIKIEATEPLDVLKEIGCDGLVIPKKYDTYYKPCFDFIITDLGIKITAATAKEFYSYDLNIGDIITHIDGNNLLEKDYFDIFEFIYAKDYTTKKFTLANGNEIEYKYEAYHDKAEIKEEANILTIKLYNLNATTQNYVYKLATEDDYEKVIIDLSQATISSYTRICQYLSLFADGKEELFSKPEKVKAYDMHKIENCEIIIGENIDPGILFFTTCINRYNTDVVVDKKSGNENYLNATIYENNEYRVLLFNYELVAVGTNSGVII